ncbi:MAG: LysR family transcriptional regulator [Oscillospiraceae bacterium]|nr:LysR family transcriptional regulator [Oscillospiraceae bacterium]
MEIRVLKYFLEVANKGSFSAAAKSLHLSQPTLSRQLGELEKNIGKKLFIRSSIRTALTEDGMFLQKRAQEIIDLTQKTESELRQSDSFIGGNIWIGAGESEGMRIVAKTINSLRKDFPNIHVHLISANATDTIERLEKGLIDFGVGVGGIDLNNYESMWLPTAHADGLLMRKDSPLASRTAITPNDLKGIPIISPRSESLRHRYEQWLGYSFDSLDIVATFNLIYNAAFLVEEGVGYALTIDRLVTTSENYPLCFVPCEPKMEVRSNIVWKKQQVFSKSSQKFLERLQELTSDSTS